MEKLNMPSVRLRFVDVRKPPPRPKATVHKTGKLGFNADAARVMSLDEAPHFKLAVSEKYPEDQRLFLVVAGEDNSEDFSSVRPAKAGDYYYMNLRNVFDRMRLKYDAQKVVYDIEKSTFGDGDMWVLTPRVKNRE